MDIEFQLVDGSWTNLIGRAKMEVPRGARSFVVKLDHLAWQEKGGIMIRFQRSAQTRKLFPEAVAWAKGIADFVNSKNPDVKLEVFTARFGSVTTIYWMADLQDLTALDRWQMALMADADYWKKVADAYDFLIGGTLVDMVMMSV